MSADDPDKGIASEQDSPMRRTKFAERHSLNWIKTQRKTIGHLTTNNKSNPLSLFKEKINDKRLLGQTTTSPWQKLNQKNAGYTQGIPSDVEDKPFGLASLRSFGSFDGVEDETNAVAPNRTSRAPYRRNFKLSNLNSDARLNSSHALNAQPSSNVGNSTFTLPRTSLLEKR